MRQAALAPDGPIEHDQPPARMTDGEGHLGHRYRSLRRSTGQQSLAAHRRGRSSPERSIIRRGFVGHIAILVYGVMEPSRGAPDEEIRAELRRWRESRPGARFTRDVDVAVMVGGDAAAETLVRYLLADRYRMIASIEQDEAGRLSTVRLACPVGGSEASPAGATWLQRSIP